MKSYSEIISDREQRLEKAEKRIHKLEFALASIYNMETKGGRSWIKPSKVARVAIKALERDNDEWSWT